MKINGAKLASQNEARITLKRATLDGVTDHELKLTAFPVGFQRILAARALNVFPQPKKIPLKDGERLVKSDDGFVQTVDQTDDPKYQKQFDAVHRRLRAYQVAELLRSDPQVEFEAKRPIDKDMPKEEIAKAWAEYADALADELDGCGFTDAELNRIVEIGRLLSCRIDVEDKLKDFLSMS